MDSTRWWYGNSGIPRPTDHRVLGKVERSASTHRSSSDVARSRRSFRLSQSGVGRGPFPSESGSKLSRSDPLFQGGGCTQGVDTMSNWNTYQQRFENHKTALYGMSFQDALRWLYSEGWYFQTDEAAWDPNDNHSYLERDHLMKDIKTNGQFGVNMDIMEPVPGPSEYLQFKSVSMVNSVYMRHGRPNFESGSWPNDVIMEELGLFSSFDAINKRSIA